ncbi:MAG: DUF2141 domain-containing protein [Rhodospirillales bacterium]|nr:DUF2141 domain-containing protein [Rhodospirillales bacterium]
MVAPTWAAELTITVTGLRSDQGMVRLALFDQASEFPKGKKLASLDVPAAKGSVTVRFEDLKPGRYAVAMHHDENGNKKMDTYILGIPKEGYGFANDAPAFFGPPSFDQAAISVPAEGAEISFAVVY